MSTNANVFNSRVTSEALEAKFRQVFPAQAGAELIQDLYASGVIQPVIDFSSVAEGSVLPQNLQTSWDFATQHQTAITAGTYTLITNTGFWKVDLNVMATSASGGASDATLRINDGSSTAIIWRMTRPNSAFTDRNAVDAGSFVVFLRAGDTLEFVLPVSNEFSTDLWWRQIADVNGNLVNPLGFTFS